MEAKAQPIRVLQVEDLEPDAELGLAQLKKAGMDFTSQRVQTEDGLRKALREFSPDIILSDFSLPGFDGLSALRIARELAPDVPFLFVSGTIGEERAVAALHNGAVDYVLKNNLTRLPSAVSRALNDAQARRERQAEKARIARLDRVLRMISGINSLMVRLRDRKELLSETCRLAIVAGGYAAAIVCLKAPGTGALQAQAWSGSEPGSADSLRDALTQPEQTRSSLLEQVVGSGKEFICNDTHTLRQHPALQARLLQSRLHSLVALPLFLDNAPMGVLVLSAREPGSLSRDELRMLREVAANLSFALQYLHKDTAVRFLSNFDSRTGLAKRSLFCDRLAKLLGTQGDEPCHVVLIMDIERLSLINDSCGRRIGDLLLQQVAERLKGHFRQTERIAHFGGGTFALAMSLGRLSPAGIGASVQERTAAFFGEPFAIEDQRIPVTARSGIAICPDHGTEAAALVQKAEAALRDARARGERQIHYSEQQQAKVLNHLALEHRLRLALASEQFELHYQPKVNVVSRRIEGAEALLRWRDPGAGLIAPAAFLPVLESSGLMEQVGDWVVRRAAHECQQWLRHGLPPVRVAVNVAPSQLHRPDFVETFLNALAGWSSLSAGLDIEITEGSLQEELAPEIMKLKALRNAGVRIAIDDFGTGYSSLGRLAKLPIDTLKIDRTFICEVPKDYAGRMLVKTVITLARAFRLSTVAEGVEHQEQLDFLWQAGCDQSQGYLHSHPLPGNEFMALLEHGRDQLVRPPEPVPSGESVSQPGERRGG
ncbi:MAG TPA: EAL domain-containing protein [Steroidobacteraceae bacterium]|nr:EAL domain-containing protein [Steroidobacteraceae bacterium]